MRFMAIESCIHRVVMQRPKNDSKIIDTQLKSLPSCGGKPRRMVINWVSHDDELLVPTQKETFKLFIMVCGVWAWKLKKPGAHTTEMAPYYWDLMRNVFFSFFFFFEKNATRKGFCFALYDFTNTMYLSEDEMIETT